MNTDNKYYLEIWIGLAKVKSNIKNNYFGDSDNAYVNVLGLANSKQDFGKKVRETFSGMNLSVTRLENVEPFNLRTKKYEVDQSLMKIAKELLKSDKKIKFSVFHTYE